ncbi:Beta-hydroxyacyl-(acyl-carrier-protein) dehydratase, FabA/FabZ [Winogradskyella psychrotolerans RS-3]|uniref:Beta-hydroxyacyl-(Acyl-carrier-protein) dehydratase, FabA/FabZ n=1 Tax=Winogradskyella psychrotolerans RS-3 TaxID=641526 RepID=S7VIE4_9FLAO|nr:beta-hydroxyacyl-ACP dehydratase [Winogradskyella psychrotolerans]EPR70015.1 Beta-hydroxyacyl-(acyl-carrier-protein) dehydratase, FabA/FabZ [Winogradskyella psychrotolerans RS-3]
MLIKGFYTVLKTTVVDTNTIHVTIKLNKDHDVFNGHFPGNPITPGVCMIQTIKEITQDQVNSTLFLQTISNIKFTALINPNINAELILELSIIEDNNTVKIKNITKFTDGTIALKCNGTFIKN